MKKISTFVAATLLATTGAQAGGLLTNTNQHINFLRSVARGASSDIDATYSNPAGTAFLGDGWKLSLNIQSAFQERNIATTWPLFPEADHTRHYSGKAAAPIIPSAFATYNKDRWGLSGFFGVIGGGGKASFDTGLPMFDVLAIGGIYKQSMGQLTPDKYDLASWMQGRQYIYGAQLGATYRFLDNLSGYAGFRMNYFSGNQSGSLEAILKEPLRTALAPMYPEGKLMGINMDVDQTGWGVTPILGVNYKVAGLTLAAKYEFKTNLNIENKTQTNTLPEPYNKEYADGVNTPNDIPAMLSVALGYEVSPQFRATVEYHYFDDKHAGMQADKQKLLARGTNEYLLGAEFDVNKTFTLSVGTQRTDYGQTDAYQQHTSFACDSWSVGLGAAVHFNEKITMNVGYFMTFYDDYTRETTDYLGTKQPGKDVFSRENKVFGVGIDYKF